MGISKFWHISFHPSHQHLTPLSDRLVSPPHNITLRQTCKRCLTTFILSIMESTRLEERLLAPSFRKWLLKLELQTGNHPSQKIFDMWKLEALADAFYCALHSEHCQTSPTCLITRPPRLHGNFITLDGTSHTIESMYFMDHKITRYNLPGQLQIFTPE